MSDEQAPTSETKSTTFEELNKLIVEAITARKLRMSDFHEIVINSWCACINNIYADTIDPNHKISFKKGVPFLNMLFANITKIHLVIGSLIGTSSEYHQLPNPLIILKDLELKVSPKSIVIDDLKNYLPSLYEIDCSYRADEPLIKLMQYPQDVFMFGVLLAECWLYLYQKEKEEKKGNEEQMSYDEPQSKGHEYYIQEALKSDTDNHIKLLVEQGMCIGCGHDRMEADNYWDRYCSLDCKEALDQFFRDWKAKRIKGDPESVVFGEVMKIFQDKRGDPKKCQRCGRSLEQDEYKRNAKHCSDCNRELKELKKTKSAVKNQTQAPLD